MVPDAIVFALAKAWKKATAGYRTRGRGLVWAEVPIDTLLVEESGVVLQ